MANVSLQTESAPATALLLAALNALHSIEDDLSDCCALLAQLERSCANPDWEFDSRSLAGLWLALDGVRKRAGIVSEELAVQTGQSGSEQA